MIDAVVTFHENPLTCGVARFSAELARRLNVPLVPLVALPHCRYGAPLISLKWSELPTALRDSLVHWPLPAQAVFLWHDNEPAFFTHHRAFTAAKLGIPALVRHATEQTRWRPLWFSMGMAHKLTWPFYVKAVDVAKINRPWSIWVSAWLHEGTTWDSMTPVIDQLERIAPTTFLGSLTDAALAWVWPQVNLFVAFFPDGLQANHTSVHAALDAGVPVLTNWGLLTPADLKDRTVDVNSLTAWPTTWPTQPSPYTWDRLLEALCVK